jgi:hypothetical protein
VGIRDSHLSQASLENPIVLVNNAGIVNGAPIQNFAINNGSASSTST